MTPRIFVVVALAVAACGCKARPVAVGPDPVSSDAAPPLAADSAPAADTAADADADAALVLPPIDRRCTTDTDCDYVAVDLSPPTTCCASCGTLIAARTWTATVRALCAKAAPLNCPELACPLGATRSRCDRGACLPVW